MSSPGGALGAQPAMRMLPVVVALGITQTVGYGTLYYAFGVLAPDMSADTGWSLTSVYGVFSLALLVSGIAAPFAGRAMDGVNPARVMAFGSLASVTALACWTLIPGRTAFAIFMIVVETVSVLVLYEAAFVVAARLVPDRARRTITGITLIAGFASTIFWPLTAWLDGFLSWREIYLAYAGINLALCFPLHLWLAGRRFARTGQEAEASEAPAGVRGTLRKPGPRKAAFYVLLVTFTAIAFVMSAVHLHLIGLLTALGLGGSAALIGALLGPSQVAGRAAELAAGDRVSVLYVAFFATAALPCGLLVLAAGAPNFWAALAFAVIFGLGQGLSYIVRGVLPLHLFGIEGYGALLGRINSVRLFVSAAAPFVTAALFEGAGAEAAIAMLCLVGTLGVLSLVALFPIVRGARE